MLRLLPHVRKALLGRHPLGTFSTAMQPHSSLSGAFGKDLPDLLEPPSPTSSSEPPRFLDLTFGTGGHTQTFLDRFPGCHVVASDCHRRAHEAALEMEASSAGGGNVIPIRAKFSQVPEKLVRELDLPLHSFDGVIIDTGPSEFHMEDAERTGMDLSRNGWLDLRLDPESAEGRLMASDALRLMNDTELFKVLRLCGGMTHTARSAVHAIVEARYMFKEFRTVEELYDVLRCASSNICERTGQDRGALSLRMLADAHRALRIFVNDELNELHFAISVVAENFLRPGSGVLALVTRSYEEEKIAYNILESRQIPVEQHKGNVRIGQGQIDKIRETHPWEMLTEEPLILESKRSWSTENRKAARVTLRGARRTNFMRSYERKVPRDLVGYQ